jgi:hypothetical protein
LKLWDTSWDVTGSIPDGVIGISYCHNLSGCTIKLQLTKSVTEMSTRTVTDLPIVFKSGNLRTCTDFFPLLPFYSTEEENISYCCALSSNRVAKIKRGKLIPGNRMSLLPYLQKIILKNLSSDKQINPFFNIFKQFTFIPPK